MAAAVSTPRTYLSPASRRRPDWETPGASDSPLLEAVENDDEAEKRERRRSKVLALQQRHLGSPSAGPERRKSMMPLSGFTNAQLTEHYTNCIKLSAENKINAKNAFGLHLIDYMADLLKQKGLTNFQVASSTLDASAKIYAGRVDAIHMETYKVLSGLGRSAGPTETAEDDGAGESMPNGEGNSGDEDAAAAAAATDAARKKKATKRGKTIETNLKNINVKKFDLDFEVDPLFQKTSAALSDGAAAGSLLLAQLRSVDDSCELLLDSLAPSGAPPRGQADDAGRRKPVDLSDFEAIYRGVNFDGLHVCSAFADFKFNDWNQDSEDSIAAMLRRANSEHAFDRHAEPEIAESQNTCADQLAGAADYADNLDTAADDDDDAASLTSEGGADGASADVGLTSGDNNHAKLAQGTISKITDGSLGVLMRMLSSEPSEYSYFSSTLLDTWAGPSYWRVKAQSKESWPTTAATDSQPKEKRATFQIDFTADVDFEPVFRTSKAATVVSKATVERYSKQFTTLPEDQHYDTKELLQFGLKPSIMVCRQKTGRASDDDDEGIGNYDYGNANDAGNYCPDGPAGGGDDEDDDAEALAGFDLTAANEATQGSFSIDGAGGGGCGLEASASEGLFGSEKSLIAAPHKVARIDIDYAKVAKKVDVKKLKAAMWSILTDDATCASKVVPIAKTTADPVGVAAAAEEDMADVSLAATGGGTVCRQSLQEVLDKLSTRLTSQALSNLSVPIAFVCLLHLANEKALKLENDKDRPFDLVISQGV